MCSNALKTVQNARNGHKVKCTYIVCNSCKKANNNRDRSRRLVGHSCNHNKHDLISFTDYTLFFDSEKKLMDSITSTCALCERFLSPINEGYSQDSQQSEATFIAYV